MTKLSWLLAVVALFWLGGAQAAVRLGTNDQLLTYFNNECFYADMFMAQSGNNGPWDANSGGAAPLNSTGAPTVPASAGFPATCPSSTMTLTWTGSGTVNVSGSCTQGPTTTVAPTTRRRSHALKPLWG